MIALRALFFVLLVLPCSMLLAHGSVTAEGDLCIIRIGFYSAHFKVFQPQTSGDTEYCEDLPSAGETVFVMDYLHNGLTQVPIEFRIIRDTTGLGRFARLSDVQALGDLSPLTVAHQPPVLEPAVYTALHTFAEEGDFLGIVTAPHPQTGVLYQAVFPFTVGSRSWGLLPLFVLLAVIAQLAYWYSLGGYARWRERRLANKSQLEMVMSLPLVLLLLGADSVQQTQWSSGSGNLRVSYQSAVEPIPLNSIHSWILHLETTSGVPIDDAKVLLTGGMPAHNHGLPTEPAVSTSLGNGNYRVDGLRFHMQGAWELYVTVERINLSDKIVIPLNL